MKTFDASPKQSPTSYEKKHFHDYGKKWILWENTVSVYTCRKTSDLKSYSIWKSQLQIIAWWHIEHITMKQQRMNTERWKLQHNKRFTRIHRAADFTWRNERHYGRPCEVLPNALRKIIDAILYLMPDPPDEKPPINLIIATHQSRHNPLIMIERWTTGE